MAIAFHFTAAWGVFVAAAVTAAATIAAVLLTNRYNARAAEKDLVRQDLLRADIAAREDRLRAEITARDDELRKEEAEREDRVRFLDDRRELYVRCFAAANDLRSALSSAERTVWFFLEGLEPAPTLLTDTERADEIRDPVKRLEEELAGVEVLAPPDVQIAGKNLRESTERLSVLSWRLYRALRNGSVDDVRKLKISERLETLDERVNIFKKAVRKDLGLK